MTTPPSAVPEPARRRRSKLPLILAAIILVPALVFGAYTAAVLKVNYSDGDRAGILQKFSRKGWICKTFEGELAMSIVPGVSPTIWEFSVRDEALRAPLDSALGKRVVLHYTEHRGVPTKCFGTTNYFVDRVRLVQ